MTTETGIDGGVLDRNRQVHFHDATAPRPTVVTPSVFVAVHHNRGRLLLVRRCDSGRWEFPGGRVDVGESVVTAALRETWEETGLRVQITGLVGLFTDPQHIVEAADGGVIRQQFVVCLRARPVKGRLRPDRHETDDVRWFPAADVCRLPIEPGADRWVRYALERRPEPHLD